MKKALGILCITLFVLAGCSNDETSSDKSVNQSPKENIHKETNKTQVTTQESTQNQSKTTSNAPQKSEKITGVWTATGKNDGVSSTWYFKDGKLVVNYVYQSTYTIAKNKDANGYTVVTIKNNKGKPHALLLKKIGSNFEGLTAEGSDYAKYLADGTIPKGQKIAFALKENAWGSTDEAIDFYEKTYKNTDNKISGNIAWENYRRDLWSLVQDGTSGNKITLHFTNISGAGGSYDQFVKDGANTIITDFDGNASYPDQPTTRYTVRNADYKVIKTEELWKQ